jgi:ubiquinone/menaquinone biosynthesis C-methylase UbiE
MADASIDVVLNVESSHCYPDMGRFFSEVARVLKPEGAFCYSDLFGSTQLAAVECRLSQTPGLQVLRSADITPEVVRAIELNRDAFAELLLGAADSRLRNMSLIANLIRTVNVQTYQKLAAGELRYHAWRVGRAAT